MPDSRFRLVLVLLSLLASTVLPAAAGELHGYSVVDDELLHYDLLTGAYRTIGPVGIGGDSVFSLADGDGDSIFGLAKEASPDSYSLYRIELATGQGTLVGTPGSLPGFYLARTADGFFYNADRDGEIYRVDPTTAAATLLVDLERRIHSLTAQDELLFVTTSLNFGLPEVATLDPEAPVLVPLGISVRAGSAAIGRHDGNVYYADAVANVHLPIFGTRVSKFDLATGEVGQVAQWMGPVSAVRPLAGLAGVTGGETVDVPVAGAAGRLLLAAFLTLAALVALQRR